MKDYTLKEWFKSYEHYDLSPQAKKDLRKVFDNSRLKIIVKEDKNNGK